MKRTYPAYKDSGVEWLGEIPHNWDVTILKRVCRFAYGDALAAEGRIDGLFSVFGSNGIVGSHDTANTLGPCLIVGRKGSFGKVTYSDNPAFAIDTTYFIDKRQTGTNLRWLYYLLQWLQLDAFSKDSAVPGLAREDAYDRLVPVCDRGVQDLIASFLDRKTTEIDALIAKKRRMIELLQEKRTAIISHSVTKGLDPNAPMKDSGVEWLGKMPGHWDILPFTKYVIEKSDYRGATPEKVTDGIFLVTARNVRMGFIDYDASQEFVRHADYDVVMRRGLPKKGDILFTTEAPLGNVALVDREDIALAQRIIRFRMHSRRLLSQFTLFAMMSGYFQSQLDSLSTGSTAEGLKASKLTHLWLVVPPLPEQNSIADYIESETSKINCMIEKVETAIDKLLEYRTALISAAVTGKLDVREEAA